MVRARGTNGRTDGKALPPKQKTLGWAARLSRLSRTLARSKESQTQELGYAAVLPTLLRDKLPLKSRVGVKRSIAFFASGLPRRAALPNQVMAC